MFLFLLASLAMADTITLDNGARFTGQLSRYTFAGDCEIKLTDGPLSGTLLVVPCTRLSAIEANEAPTVEAAPPSVPTPPALAVETSLVALAPAPTPARPPTASIVDTEPESKLANEQPGIETPRALQVEAVVDTQPMAIPDEDSPIVEASGANTPPLGAAADETAPPSSETRETGDIPSIEATVAPRSPLTAISVPPSKQEPTAKKEFMASLPPGVEVQDGE